VIYIIMEAAEHKSDSTNSHLHY